MTISYNDVLSVVRRPRRDNKMIDNHITANDYLVGADIGNGTMCLSTPESEVCAPHAFRQLSGDELNDLVARGDNHPFVYYVNGIPFMLGETVTTDDSNKFAVKMGSERYTHNYIGAILAVLLFNGLKDGQESINLMMNHPPSHVMYRPDIIDATQATFMVRHQGVEKKFTVNQTLCCDEPILGYTNALYSDNGRKIAKPALLSGRWLMVDIGAFTTDLTLVVDGNPDTSRQGNQSVRFGMMDVLRRFNQNMRMGQPKFFSRIQTENQSRLRQAFATDTFNGGGFGDLDVSTYVNSAAKHGVDTISKAMTSLVGGIAEIDGMVLSGGGGAEASLGRFFNDEIMGKTVVGNLPVMYCENEDSEMHMATVRGARKLLLYLKSVDSLWVE